MKTPWSNFHLFAVGTFLGVTMVANSQLFSYTNSFPLFTQTNLSEATAPVVTNGESTIDPNTILPLIEMRDIPISTIIENLARIGNINYLIHVGSGEQWPGSDANEPLLTFHWENLTARQALLRLLKENNLVLIENSTTPIAQIANKNQVVNPVDASLLGSDTNEAAPLIQFKDVPLDEAIKQLANGAQIKVVIDSTLSRRGITLDKHVFHKPKLSFSLKNVTARQGIVALCENYNLIILKDAATGDIQIKQRN